MKHLAATGTLAASAAMILAVRLVGTPAATAASGARATVAATPFARRAMPSRQPNAVEPRDNRLLMPRTGDPHWPETTPNRFPEFLQLVRDTLGYDQDLPRPGAVLLSGGARRRGETERFSLLVGSGGRFVSRLEGRALQSQGFDGKTGWSQTRGTAPSSTAPVSYSNFHLPIWIQTGWWLDPSSPVRLALDASNSNLRQIALKVSMSNADRPIRLVLDRVTLRPISLLVESTAGNESWLFNDYQPVHGIQMAHHLCYVGPSGRDMFHLKSSTAVQTVDNKAFTADANSTKRMAAHITKATAYG